MFITCNDNANIATIQLQRQLDSASDWFNRWRIKINGSKTVAILFGHAVNSYNRKLPWNHEAKYLGVTIG
jgi:hypothetical protein